MLYLPKEKRDQIAPLFAGWEDTFVWSCLQGVMGAAWADREASPAAAQIVVGDFCYFAGAADAALAGHIPESFPSGQILMVPPDESWSAAIEAAHPGRAARFTRYAIKKEPGVFNTARLEAFCRRLPGAYRLVPIDEALFRRAAEEPWSRDFCSQFEGWQQYRDMGLGFAALCGDELVGGASSYTVYRGGIEIEIGTKEGHRRQGIARACAARLILACLSRGLYPSWDAANRESLHLAETLGYHFDRPYTAYAVKAR